MHSFMLLRKLWLVLPFAVAAAAVETAEIEKRLAAITPEHPRLFFTKAQEAALKQKIAAEPLLTQAYQEVLAQSQAMLKLPPVEHKKIGRRLLDKSRTCLQRVIHLAFAYRLTGEARYLERAKQELLATAAFSDWNPSHFLDVAEMTAALAIGYDWLYGALDADTRAKLRQAIMAKGLKPSLAVKGGWVKGHNNWNQVCHGGLTLGALALCEDERATAVAILTRAVNGLPAAMHGYAPDGAYPEGPGYWSYGTTYNVLWLAACEAALGTDFGLAKLPGFMATADYYLHATGPTGLYFNYSDCGSGGGVTPAMYWFASRRHEPALLWNEQRLLAETCAGRWQSDKGPDRFFPLLLVWAGAALKSQPPATLRWVGQGTTPVAMFRSGWDDKAVYVAFKGGTPSASHAHMDIGTFVMDADGVRWAEDFGMQYYHSLESVGVNLWSSGQDAERWRVFRLGNPGHNTLVVNGRLQQVKGRASLTSSKPGCGLVDLTSVYAGQLARAVRGVTLQPDRTVLVQDEIQALKEPATVRWAFITSAEATCDGSTALLQRNGQKLAVRVLSPAGVTVKTYQTDPPPGKFDARNEGTRMVGFEVQLPAGGQQTLTVALVPGGKR
jgi:hypothetical protein